MQRSGTHPLSVSEITGLLKSTLESEFSEVSIEGEISNLRPSSTGHLYFSLKDESAMISAVMFRNALSRLSFEPTDGAMVLVRGSISVYARRGVYQVICREIEAAGVGRILQMLEERKRKLAAEGLFDPERKQPIPLFPSRIAIVTSPTGAAIRDILQVLSRRNAGLKVTILPAPVQGSEAAPRIASQILRADRYGLGEVIIVTRGGGSLEDLLPFSEEIVVRAITASSTPVISAVGHEIDTTLSDLAADLRAPTPSAAAEIVSAQREELMNRVMTAGRNIVRGLLEKHSRARFTLHQFRPESLEQNFRVLIQPFLQRLDDAKDEIIRAIQQRTERTSQRVLVASREIESCSPFEILKRGYAVIRRETDNVLVTQCAAVSEGDRITVQLTDGGLSAGINAVYPGQSPGRSPGSFEADSEEDR